MRTIWVGALCALFVLPAPARADGQVLDTLAAVRRACRAARGRTDPRLYIVAIDPGWGFSSYRPREDVLPVDTHRNLAAFDGHVSLLMSGLEPISFEVDSERAEALEHAASSGARLSVGFFLGFDEPRRQACVIRNDHAVTTVRADLAFAEIRSSEGRRMARMETDRLRAWLDDREALAIPGEGPRGAVEAAYFENGSRAPDAWTNALGTAAVRGRIAQCHTAGVARGAAAEGQVVTRLNVETRTGRVRRADVALSSLGDSEEAECIARALGGTAHLPAGPASWRAEFVDLTVQVRLTAERASRP